MKLKDALETVLELATENALDPKEEYDDALQAEVDKQEAALERVHDFLYSEMPSYHKCLE